MNRILIALLILSFSATAQAQSWPAKPVRFIVPAGQGGTIDPLSRFFAEAYARAFGQGFVIDNRPGAQGNAGLAAIAKSDPDGYTIGMAASSMIAINPHLYATMPYDPRKELAGIVLVGDVPNILVVHPEVPVKTMAEFTAYAKANPGKLNFGSTGNGSSMHLAGELYKTLTATLMTHIPYKVPADATNDLISGRTQLMFQLMTGIQGQVKAGRVRPIAVLSGKRWPGLPDVPTSVEQGMGNLKSSVWFAVVAPNGVPAAVVERINAETNKLLADQAFRDRVQALGAAPMGGSAADYRRLYDEEFVRWAAVVKASGAKID
ncbi:MAG: tripartite tricarboxylate transporter substrate binding protein [Betaproteobacteria bacterium]|nr:tripartite tricarboxylate transporter substrate binding protein [Betaproteobacteria bacterium]